MSIKYHKPQPFKEGRALRSGRGPRDLQRDKALQPTVSVDNTSIVAELKSQIGLLRDELHTRPVQKGYSAEEFDAELVKATEQIIDGVENKSKAKVAKLKKIITDYEQTMAGLSNELTTVRSKLQFKEKEVVKLIDKIRKYESKIEILDNKLISAEEIIKTKDDSISTLKTTGLVVESTDPDRPQMEEAFVDPLEKGFDQSLELHIKIKEDIQGDTKVDAKVDKLKSLLGKLPVGG